MTISGDRVRQAREFAGLTQAGLAERIGLTQAAISQLETGQIRRGCNQDCLCYWLPYRLLHAN